MFKTRSVMAEMAGEIDQEGPASTLQDNEAYFRSHSQCIGYKTLAFFIYYQSMWHILRIVTMGVKTMCSEEIGFF